MAATTTVLKDAVIAVRGVDFSGQSNQATITMTQNTEAANAFGDNTEIFAPTISALSGNVGGFYRGDPEDAEVFSILNGPTDGVDLLMAKDAALGSTAYLMKATVTGNENSAAHGELFKFSFDFSGGGLETKKGLLMENGDFSANGNGTGQQLGAVTADQTLYAQLHVVSAGTTMDALIESDADSGFGTAVTQITFDTVTAVGSQRKSKAGAITDDYYRLVLSNVTGTFTIILALAIG